MTERTPAEKTRGAIFDIQRFSIHDGPGIRTTVFLKGCPLRCRWCHNPEGMSGEPQLAYYPSRCIDCGACFKACPFHALARGGDPAERLDRTRCAVCGTCVRVCSTEALQMAGRRTSAGEIMETIRRDVPFYRTSGGGMTLSGGEPLYQPELSLALLEMAREEGIHTAVETCGLAPWETLRPIADRTDLFLYDLKAISPAKHRRLCRADNAQILANARALSECGADLLFRAPIVPKLNDTRKDIELLADFLLSLARRHPLELMPYHRIGSGKYDTLGMTYPIPDVPAADDLGRVERALTERGIDLIIDR